MTKSSNDPTEPPEAMMDADRLLELSRTLTVQVTGDGTVLAARGGFGGFLGFDPAALVGSNVFDFVAEQDAGHLATYFNQSVDESSDSIALPIPFRISVVDADSFLHPVDIIPTGIRRDGGETFWVAVLVPVALYGSVTRSLDLEMEGASRSDVKRMLCEELTVDNANYTSRWVLVQFGGGDRIDVSTARHDDQHIAEAIRQDVVAGWEPWRRMEPSTVAAIPPPSIGTSTFAAMSKRGWQRSIVAPVHVRDRLAAVYFLVGRVPDDHVSDKVNENVQARVRKLVGATALLIERWETFDQLLLDAAHDPLTGLRNARSLRAAVDDHRGGGAVLFIDVDRFKPVNDTYGHAIGDLVLILIADRIVDACRDTDFVARVGGDEFVVLLADADADAAATRGRQVIDAVARPLDLDEGPHEVSVSVGVSMLDGAGSIESADKALLAAKRAGRSQLVVAPIH